MSSTCGPRHRSMKPGARGTAVVLGLGRRVLVGADLAPVPRARHRVGRRVVDDLQLEPVAVEDLARLVGRDLVAHERLVLVDDLADAGVDAVEVVGGERGAARQLEVVVEAVLDRRADAERGPGEQVEHRLRQHVGRRVADRVQPPLAVGRDDGDAVAVGQLGAEVALVTVDLGDDRRLGQPRPDALGQAERGGARCHGPRGTVGQVDRDVGHAREVTDRCRRLPNRMRRRVEPEADAADSARRAARLPCPVGPQHEVVGWAGMASGLRVAYSSTYSWRDSARISYISSSVSSRSTSRSPVRSR